VVWQIELLLQRADAIVAQAEQRRQLERFRCATDQQKRIAELLRIARAARAELGSAPMRAEDPARLHFQVQLAISHEKAVEARDQAESCLTDGSRYQAPVDVSVQEVP
jgi:Tfp pilus assembly protein PilN